MTKKRKAVILTVVVISLFTAFTVLTLYPLLSPIPSLPIKPVILYYNYENLPFNASEFPAIVQTTSEHHFNTLMVLVYYNHREIFNESTLNYFFTYARSKSLTFVPSFYVESLGDNFNSTGFPWINLDMEKIAPTLQRFVYARASDQSSGLVSITSPYGQPVEFSPPLDILETYSSMPSFWFMQLSYWHTDHICSVASWMLHSQQEYDSEKNYCLKYSQGVMVFDYFNLLRSHLN